MNGGIENRISVLFVCLGNICRSPIAEGAFRAAALQSGLDCHVDSAGTAAYHLGSPPDRRAVAVSRTHGIEIGAQIARQIVHDDFFRFTHIIAMDPANLSAIKARAPRDGPACIAMLMDAVKGRAGEAVADPYHGNADDFAATFGVISEGVDALVARFVRDGVNLRL